MFDGFKKSDYEAFQKHKWTNKDFDDERAEVYDKLYEIREILTPHMQRVNPRFSGRIAQSHFYRKNQVVDRLWLSFIITESRKYIQLPQLHIDLHNRGVFVGLGIPVKTEKYKSNMAKWLVGHSSEALKMLRKLDYEHMHFLAAGEYGHDISELSIIDIKSIGKGILEETEWTSWGEFYHRSERHILGTSAFAGRALIILKKVYPVFAVAMGLTKTIQMLKPATKPRSTPRKKKHSKTPPIPPSSQQERVEYDSKGMVVARNPEIVTWVKEIEESTCQVCGKAIRLPNGHKSIDVHHIWPLGSPHGGYELGFDCTENAICLCPNHHREMELGVFHIQLDTLKIIYHDISNTYHETNLQLHPEHNLGDEYLEYHREFVFEKWDY